MAMIELAEGETLTIRAMGAVVFVTNGTTATSTAIDVRVEGGCVSSIQHRAPSADHEEQVGVNVYPLDAHADSD